MSYLKALEVDVLTLPSDPTYSVRMKRAASYGDIEGARSAMLHVTSSTSVAGIVSTMEWLAYVQTLTLNLIVDWNLTDENDRPLEVTRANLDRLDAKDGDFLALEAQKRSQPRPEVQEIPFEKASITS